MADSGTYTPETIARKLAMAQQLLGDRKKPITHWAEGLDELAKGYFGGKMYGDAETAQNEGDTRSREFIASLLSGGAPATGPQGPSPEAMQPPPQSVQPMGDLAGMPRGLRNNNPLNIEAGGFTQGQPGFSGSDGRFAKFASVDQGLGAANKLLDVYQNKHGLNTISGIINRWAPAADGNNVSAYAANVAKQLGVDPNAPITPEMRPQLIAAMAQHENGRPLPQGAMPQQMAQAAPQGNPMQARIVEALRSKDPFISRAAQGMAGGMLQRQMEGDKPTDEMREYNLYKNQGGKKSFFDYKADLKRAGGTQVTVDNKQESEYEKITGKQFGEMNAEIPKNAMSARGKIAKIDRMTQLLSDPAIYTGTGGESVLELKKLAKAAGIDVGDLGGAEAVRAIGNEFALELRNPSGGAGMPGAMSDKDREFLQTIPPGLSKTPEGNATMADYLKRIAQRSLDVERLRQQYVKKNGRLNEGFYSAMSDYADANPIFPEGNKPAPPAAAPAAGPNIDDLLKKYGR